MCRNGLRGVVFLYAMVSLFVFAHCGEKKECVFASDCKSGEFCLEGKCKERQVVRCQSGKDCSATSVCEKGFCIPKVVPKREVPTSTEKMKDGGTNEKPPEILSPDFVPVNKSCVFNKECSAQGVCQVSIVNGEAKKRCTHPKGKKEGEKCDVGTDCSSGLCHNRACVSLCLAHQHCKQTQHCASVLYIDKIQMRACLAGARTTCSSHLDCKSGQFCQAAFDSAKRKSTTLCKEPVGKDIEPSGTNCKPDDFPGTCASHVCDRVLKKCLNPCQPGLSCKTKGYECQKFPFLGGSIFACYQPPKSCTKQSDCATGTHCSVLLKDEKIIFRCLRESQSQPKKVGESCNREAKFPGECQTGLCYAKDGGKKGVCVGTCGADTDCAKYADTPLCGKLTFGKGRFASACTASQTPCSTDQNCSKTEPVCALSLLKGIARFRCQKEGSGTLKQGARCQDTNGFSNKCRNRFCVRGLNECVEPCGTAEDCSKGLVCRDVFVKGSTFKGCVHPLLASCTQRFGCTYPLTCVSKEDNSEGSSKIVGVCLRENGLGFGSDCDPPQNRTFTNNCQSKICHPKSKLCTSICKTSKDCVRGLCSSIKIQIDNNDVSVNVCNSSCIVAADCPTGQRCSATVNSRSSVRLLCLAADSKKKKRGSVCDRNASLDDECASGICSVLNQKCTTHCKLDKHCAKGEICASTYVTKKDANGTNRRFLTQACVPELGSCLTNEHCFNNDSCRLVLHGSRGVKECVARSGSLQSDNGVCDPTKNVPAGCLSGICDPKTKLCTKHCLSDADCPSIKGSKCLGFKLGSSVFKACLKP